MPYHTTNSPRRSGGNTNTGFRKRSYGGGGGGGGSRRRGPSKTYIHPSRFIKAAKPRSEEEVYIPTYQFNDFNMHELIKANALKKGLLTPTPIQDQSIPHGLEGKDIVGIANTGTGKTIAFAIPVLQELITNPDSRAIIMAPTRELAQQIEEEFRIIGRGSGLTGALLIGGSSMGIQLRDLRGSPQVIIGTPGRIKDHIERRTLPIEKFNVVVLDEVDRMLDMGFIDDMRQILEQVNPQRQSFFFSATMDPKVATLIKTFTNDAVTISVKTGETSDYVEQDIVPYQTASQKMLQLQTLLNDASVGKALVFDETQRSVERLNEDLMALGFKADAIHGGKSQGQRQRALDKFKKSHINILVATDVAARGIDVADITHVINYSEPQAYDDYVHRIGRAGRAGRTGFAYTFVKA